jgi:MFS family permease
MNLDIGFSEAQYGALASVAFTALFAIASLFAGRLADRNDRKLLTIGSTVAWSAAIFATALGEDYNQVLAARIFMGLACAFSTPSAYTLIRDLVSKERAALANSLYGSGVYLGGGLSSLSILLDGRIGWRGTCEVIAAFGLLATISAAVFLPSDPNIKTDDALKGYTKKDDDAVIASETSNEGDTTSAFADVGEILSIPRVQWLFAGSFLRFCSGLCIGVWAAPYYKLAFPDDATSYAVINAVIVGLCGVTSGIVGGVVADKTATWAASSGSDENAGRLIVPIVGSLLAVPAWYLASHASTFDSAMAWLAIEYLVAECWFGPTVAVLQSEVGKSQGGTAQGLFTLTGAIGNLAPSLVGILYGQQASVAGAINKSDILSTLLANGVCAGYLLSAACFAISATRDENMKEVS